jgi:hypothetical protein
MDSAVLGLASPLMVNVEGKVARGLTMDSVVLGLASPLMVDGGWCSGLAMDSVVLGLASPLMVDGGWCSKMPEVALEDAIEFHAFAPPLEALACV